MPQQNFLGSEGSSTARSRRCRLRWAAIPAVMLVGFSLAVPPQLAVAASPEKAPSGADAMTQERIDDANDAYNDATAALEFVTMSDPELAGPADAVETAEEIAYDSAAPYFERIRNWSAAKGFEAQAVVANGDVVGANEPEYADYQDGEDTKVAGWYRAAERVMTENFPDAHMMFTQGNHDIAGLMGTTFDEKHAEDENWSYPRAEDDFVGNFHTTVEGVDFIGLDYNGPSEFGYEGQHTGYQDFIPATLEEITSAPDYDPAKPIFVFAHSGYAGTSLGGPFHADYDMMGPDGRADHPVRLPAGHARFGAHALLLESRDEHLPEGLHDLRERVDELHLPGCPWGLHRRRVLRRQPGRSDFGYSDEEQ